MSEDLETEAAKVCPHCAAGHQPARRASTGEWVHTNPIGKPPFGQWSQSYCLATKIRNDEANG